MLAELGPISWTHRSTALVEFFALRTLALLRWRDGITLAERAGLDGADGQLTINLVELLLQSASSIGRLAVVVVWHNCGPKNDRILCC